MADHNSSGIFGAPSGSVRSRSAAAAAAAAVDRATLVTFTVGADTLAAPVETVERVLRFVDPSPLPGMPDWLEGVIEHRNVMVPVIDLRKRFGRNSVATGATTRLVVFNTQPDWLAAIVDAVTEVVTVDASSIAPAPALVRGLSGAYLLGMVTHKAQVMLVLDIARVLTASEALTLQELQSEQPVPPND